MLPAMEDNATKHQEAVSTSTGPPPTLVSDTRWWNLRVFMNLVIIGCGLGLWGYDVALIAPLVSLPLFVQKFQGYGINGALAFSATNLSLLVSLPICGGAIGSFTATPVQKRLGRKKSLLIAYGLFCTPGAVLQLFAPDLAAFIVGRFWNYIGISMLTNISTIYQSDIVPVSVRARAVGFTVAGYAAASLLATVVVWASEKIGDRRQYMIPLAIQAAIPASLFFLTLLVTESPMWLISKGRLHDAKVSLASLRRGNIERVDAEISSAVVALKQDQSLRANVSPWSIFKPAHLERTLSSAVPYCASQVGGQILTSTYSTVILIQSGVADPFRITVIIFVAQFIGTIVGPVIVDKIGRRPVALYGFTLLFLLDIVLGSLACAGLKTDPQRLAFASLCIVFFFFNAVTFQSLCYLAPTEIPTAALREPSQSWSLIWAFSTAVITSFAVPQITNPDAGNLGAKAFLIFAGCMALTLVWTFFFYGETANRALAEIDELYASGIPKRNWKGYQTSATREFTSNVLEDKVKKVEC